MRATTFRSMIVRFRVQLMKVNIPASKKTSETSAVPNLSTEWRPCITLAVISSMDDRYKVSAVESAHWGVSLLPFVCDNGLLSMHGAGGSRPLTPTHINYTHYIRLSTPWHHKEGWKYTRIKAECPFKKSACSSRVCDCILPYHHCFYFEHWN